RLMDTPPTVTLSDSPRKRPNQPCEGFLSLPLWRRAEAGSPPGVGIRQRHAAPTLVPRELPARPAALIHRSEQRALARDRAQRARQDRFRSGEGFPDSRRADVHTVRRSTQTLDPRGRIIQRSAKRVEL